MVDSFQVGTAEQASLDGHAKSVEQTLPDDAPPLVLVRRWVSDVLGDASEDLRLDVVLVCTELVTNAYDHARGPRTVRTRLLPGGRVRIEVRDGSADEMPRLGRSRISDTRGRGLVMVDRLCDRWGTEQHPDGKTVWAELADEHD